MQFFTWQCSSLSSKRSTEKENLNKHWKHLEKTTFGRWCLCLGLLVGWNLLYVFWISLVLLLMVLIYLFFRQDNTFVIDSRVSFNFVFIWIKKIVSCLFYFCTCMSLCIHLLQKKIQIWNKFRKKNVFYRSLWSAELLLFWKASQS